MKIQSQATVLEAAQLIITNVRKEPTLQKQLTPYGFTPKRMQEGTELFTAAQLHQQTQINHYDQKYAIAHQLDHDFKTVCATLKDHVQVVRTIFRNDPTTLHTFKVNRLATGKWACIQQAIYFYGQLQNYVAALKPFGITTEVIAQSLAAAEAVLEMKSDRTRTKGMAEDSTQEKQRAFQALRAWVMDFRRTARLAFQGNPQMLEVFGIRVRSTAKG
jgi:hypothetical protein